jgi:hypothetical protein
MPPTLQTQPGLQEEATQQTERDEEEEMKVRGGARRWCAVFQPTFLPTLGPSRRIAPCRATALRPYRPNRASTAATGPRTTSTRSCGTWARAGTTSGQDAAQIRRKGNRREKKKGRGRGRADSRRATARANNNTQRTASLTHSVRSRACGWGRCDE